MSQVTLIRHGQANSHAKTEEDYDRLSPLGHQQSAWLGAYLSETGTKYTRHFVGTLRRHRETCAGIVPDVEATHDSRLNELEYFKLAQSLEAEHGIAAPTDPSAFAAHFPVALAHWEADRLEGAPERFSHFEARVKDALAEIAGGTGPSMVVTSGGVIGMAMRLHLGLDVPAMARVCLAIMNASMHHLRPVGGVLSPVAFNVVPHLDHPSRHHARTHV